MTLSPAHRGIFLSDVATGDGLRVALKDTIDVAGEVTTAGSRALATQAPAARDAEIVDRLRHAGCTIVGRTNMHELAFGVTGLNSWTGTPINPLYPTLAPGGSSSGSAAAVAAGLADIAIGTDTGGSVRVPAASCGVVGLKPTFGRVSRAGVMPAESSLDCVGPFARDVAGIEQAMAIIATDWQDAPALPAPRIAFLDTSAEAEIVHIVRRAIEAAFAATDAHLEDIEGAQQAGLSIIGRECWTAFGGLTQTGLVGRDVHDRLLAASQVTDTQLEEAEIVRARFTARVDELLQHFDALALPTLPCLPLTLLEAADLKAAIPITRHCRPFNLSGHPAIALPVGEIDGFPVSLQLVGRKGEDEALCTLARLVPLFIKGEAQ